MDAASLSVPRWLRCAEHAPAQVAAGETLLLPVRTAGLAPALARPMPGSSGSRVMPNRVGERLRTSDASQICPLSSFLTGLFLRHTSRSPATGSCAGKPFSSRSRSL